MGKAQRRHIPLSLGEVAQCIDHSRHLRCDQPESVADLQQLRVAVYKLARRPEVENRPRLRRRLSEGMHMGHDVMPERPLQFRGSCVVDIFKVRPQLRDLLIADGQPQRLLRLGQCQPQASPRGEFPLRRPDLLHLCGGVAGGQRRLVRAVRIVHRVAVLGEKRRKIANWRDNRANVMVA